MTAAGMALLGYLVGSIPFGYLLARLAGLGDIRQVGSGNIGATNVLRTGRKGLAAATLLLDGGKGAAAVLLAAPYAEAQLAGLFAVLGHCTSPWMGFRGGKGVATALGAILAWCWPAGIGTCLVWLAVALLARRSSLAALAACVAAPLLMLLLRPDAAPATALAALLVIARHHANIRRLLAGTEPKIGAKA